MNQKEIMNYLACDDPAGLFREADRVRQDYCGDEVHLRAIIEFSNYCRRDCRYCGLRKGNLKLPRYRMSVAEILLSVAQAVEVGYETVVLQSGEDDYYSIDELCKLVRAIKGRFQVALTLSIGERSYEDYKRLREAGADRYLLKFETSDPDLFRKLKPDSSYEERLQCLRWLKELGYQVGSGSMVGLPGQTLEILAEDLLLIQKFDFDMAGIGPFIPHPETPLAHAARGPLELVLKMVALARILTKNSHLPATTATATIDPMGRQKALQCGANIIMPNMTPMPYRRLYEIYPNKICIDERPGDCDPCLDLMLASVGRRRARGPGHSLKQTVA